jgi:hypothetical protein
MDKIHCMPEILSFTLYIPYSCVNSDWFYFINEFRLCFSYTRSGTSSNTGKAYYLDGRFVDNGIYDIGSYTYKADDRRPECVAGREDLLKLMVVQCSFSISPRVNDFHRISINRAFFWFLTKIMVITVFYEINSLHVH